MRHDDAAILTLWRDVVVPLAASQHDVVARAQLLRRGVPEAVVRRWLARGALTRRGPGVYEVGRRRAGYDSRCWRALVAMRGTVALSHVSSAAVLGLLPPPQGPMHVTATVRGGRRRPDLVVHLDPLLVPASICLLAGLPCLPAARTLVDIAGTCDARSLRRAWDRAVAADLVDPVALERELGRRRRGSTAVRRLLREWSGADEPVDVASVLERVVVGDVLAGVHPRPPQTNVVVRGLRRDHEVDVLYADAGLAVECDGWRHHRTRAARERDLARDADLAAVGVRTLRTSWRLATDDPGALRGAVAAALRDRVGASVADRVLGPAASVSRSRPPGPRRDAA